MFRGARIRTLRREREGMTSNLARKIVQQIDAGALAKIREFFQKKKKRNTTNYGEGGVTCDELVDVVSGLLLGNNNHKAKNSNTDFDTEDIYRVFQVITASTSAVPVVADDDDDDEDTERECEGLITWEMFMNFVVDTSSQTGLRDSTTFDTAKVVSNPGTHETKPLASHLFTSHFRAVESISHVVVVPSIPGGSKHEQQQQQQQTRVLFVVNKRTVRTGFYDDDHSNRKFFSSDKNSSLANGMLHVDPTFEWSTREPITCLTYVSSTQQVAVGIQRPPSIVLLGTTTSHNKAVVVIREVACESSPCSIASIPKTSFVVVGHTNGSMSLWNAGVGLQPNLTFLTKTTESFSSAITFVKHFSKEFAVFGTLSGQVGLMRITPSNLSVVQSTSITTKLMDLSVRNDLGYIFALDEKGVVRGFQASTEDGGRVAFHAPLLLQDFSESIARPIAMNCYATPAGNIQVCTLHKDGSVRTWDLDSRQYHTTSCPLIRTRGTTKEQQEEQKQQSVSFVIPLPEGVFLFGSVVGHCYRFGKKHITANMIRDDNAAEEDDDDVHSSMRVAILGYDSIDNVVVTLHRNNTYCQWSIRTGLLIQRYNVRIPKEEQQQQAMTSHLHHDEHFITGVYCSSTRCFYAGSTRGRIHIISTATASITRTWRAHAEAVSWVRVSIANNYCLSCDVTGHLSQSRIKTRPDDSPSWNFREKKSVCTFDVMKNWTLFENRLYRMQRGKPSSWHHLLGTDSFTHVLFLYTCYDDKVTYACGVTNVGDIVVYAIISVVEEEQGVEFTNIHIKAKRRWSHTHQGSVSTITTVQFMTTATNDRVLYVADEDGYVTSYDVSELDDGRDNPDNIHFTDTLRIARSSPCSQLEHIQDEIWVDEEFNQNIVPTILSRWVCHKDNQMEDIGTSTSLSVHSLLLIQEENLVITEGRKGELTVWSLAGSHLGELGTSRHTTYLVETEQDVTSSTTTALNNTSSPNTKKLPPLSSKGHRATSARQGVTRQQNDLPPRAETATLTHHHHNNTTTTKTTPMVSVPFFLTEPSPTDLSPKPPTMTSSVVQALCFDASPMSVKSNSVSNVQQQLQQQPAKRALYTTTTPTPGFTTKATTTPAPTYVMPRASNQYHNKHTVSTASATRVEKRRFGSVILPQIR